MYFDLTGAQNMWRDSVHEFVAKEVKPRAQEVAETAQFNWKAARKMGSIGLLGLNIPEGYGGSGVDAFSAAIGFEEMGWGCGSTALAISTHNSLGCAPITNYGSVELKQKYLPRAAGGEGKLAALALTEPGAGSDLKGGVLTRAELDGEEWVISGNKSWCTNAGIADFIVTFVRTKPDKGSNSLSLILVPTDKGGLHIAPPEKKMGLMGSPTYAVTYDNVRVPSANLVGKEGRGLHQTLAMLDGARIGIGALSVGLAQAALEAALKFAKERHAFEQPISNFQAIQWMLADAETEIHAARLMVYHAAYEKEIGRPLTKIAAMAKLFATEMAERVCRNAIQIHGGYGYSREYNVEGIYRDARLMTIGEGTSEVQRLVIARRLLQEA